MHASYEDLPRLELPLGQDVFVSDSTLRDGAQMPGVVIKVKYGINEDFRIKELDAPPLEVKEVGGE